MLAKEIGDNPQLREINDWVLKTNRPLNSALRLASRLETQYDGLDYDQLDACWELINDRWVMTGSMYCDDAAGAYGSVLAQKFPYIQDPELIFLHPAILGATHTFIRFTEANEEFIIDPTYGQINKKPNRVLFTGWKNVPNLYQPLLDEDFIKDDLADWAVLNPYQVADFAIGGEVRPHSLGRWGKYDFGEGIKLRPLDYIIKKLLEV